MRLTVIGCSGSFPGPDSAASCYLLEHDGHRVLLDLGNGALGPLQNHVSLDQIDAVLLSHLHADHYFDLCSYYVARKYDPHREYPALRVFGPSKTREQVPRAYGVSAESFDGLFTFATHQAVTEVGPFRITTDRVSHPIEAYGLRVEAGGKVLSYSGDTARCESLVALAKDADLLVAEASFVTGADHPPDLHMTGREAGDVAAAARAGQLLITHVPPWHAREDAVAEAAQTYDGPVTAAEPGLVLDV